VRPSERRLPVGRVLVRGRSMEPTLHDGDHLLVHWGGAPRPGRLVVVRWPGRPLSVKRAGVLADDGWWVERDNAAEGVDSWQAGAVPPADVLGTVLLRLWPLRRGGRLSRG
jgi:phage repressor protein C with HTH and peptisase S24 domain